MDLGAALRRLQGLEALCARQADELAATRRCLQKAGVLRPEAVAAELHRLGFERSRFAHPLGPAPSLADAATPEALVAIAAFAGSSAAAALTLVAPPLRRAREEAASLLPTPLRIYAIGGFNELRGGRLSVVECYNPERGSWSPAARALPAARDGLGAVALAGHVYAVGGSNSHYEAVDTVERYDPRAGSWEVLAPLSVARRALAVVDLDGSVYALGGHDDRETLRVAERFDLAAGRWRQVAPMRVARWYLAAVAHGGALYAVGGADEDLNPMGVVERYDPAQDRWQPAPPLPTARGALAVAAVGSRIYALGGGDLLGPLSTVEVYDPARDEWRQVASMPTARCGISAAVADGCIYVMGGNGSGFISVADDSKLDTVERYDPRLDAWERVAAMPTARSHLAAVTAAALGRPAPATALVGAL